MEKDLVVFGAKHGHSVFFDDLKAKLVNVDLELARDKVQERLWRDRFAQQQPVGDFIQVFRFKADVVVLRVLVREPGRVWLAVQQIMVFRDFVLVHCLVIADQEELNFRASSKI